MQRGQKPPWHWRLHVGVGPIRATPTAKRKARAFLKIDGAAGSWGLAPRHAPPEYRAPAPVARHRHVAAHHARELAGDGEAQTGAAEALSGRASPPHRGPAREEITLLVDGLPQTLEVVRQERIHGQEAYWVCPRCGE